MAQEAMNGRTRIRLQQVFCADVIREQHGSEEAKPTMDRGMA